VGLVGCWFESCNPFALIGGWGGRAYGLRWGRGVIECYILNKRGIC